MIIIINNIIILVAIIIIIIISSSSINNHNIFSYLIYFILYIYLLNTPMWNPYYVPPFWIFIEILWRHKALN